jgi:hypothetical protein
MATGQDPPVPSTREELIDRLRTYRSQTDTGVSVDPRLIVAESLIAAVRKIIIDDADVITNAGRKRRLFTGSMRDVFQTVETRCTQPACGVHGRDCDIDHLIGWTRPGGETRLDQAGSQCHFHNVEKERRGFTVYRDEQGRWHTLRPDGTEIAPLPPRDTRW